jgi:hypothetical protein
MKVRSDSLASKLTADQRDELLTSLDAGVALKDALKLLVGWGIETSLAALSRFYSTHAFGWKLERAKAAAEVTREVSGFADDQARLLEQKTFEALASVDVSPKVLLAFQALKLKRRALDLMEDKWQVETCKKFLVWFKDQRAREIADNAGMTNAEKIAALRKNYFADVDAAEAMGAVELPE